MYIYIKFELFYFFCSRIRSNPIGKYATERKGGNLGLSQTLLKHMTPKEKAVILDHPVEYGEE